MAKPFKAKGGKLRALPDERDVARFASGAAEHNTTLDSKPWEAFDPKEKPTSGLNLRLNEYQLTLLRYIAEADDRSLQQTIKRLLIPAAQEVAQRIVEEKD